MIDLEAEMKECAEAMEEAIGSHLSHLPDAPDRLVAAMRHATLGGGKRLRPLLVRQSAQLFGESPLRSRATQVAVELVHCYSLVHDDLPAMDDDDLRRGQPSVHKAFDEATAILAGDALLTLAFATLQHAHAYSEIVVALMGELAAAAGASGMVGGQMRDIEAETNAELSAGHIVLMQTMKTGALIRASVRMGAILGQADAEGLDAVTRYGDAIGRAYQIADDLLDLTSTTEALGKGVGKDVARGKQTLVGHIGEAEARAHLGELIAHANESLSRFGPEADGLRATAQYIAARQS